MATPPALLVLAGGSGQRLGGVCKADLRVNGRRLLDIVLESVPTTTCRVVVAPPTVAVPQGVHQTLENPPGGGPVAGIAAGLTLLDRIAPPGTPGAPADVLVLACDMPGAPALVPALLEGAKHRRSSTDGVVAVHPDGHREHLALCVSRKALFEVLHAGGHRDRSVRSVLEQLTVAPVEVPAWAADDIDEWEQWERWESRT
ncbi:NTP transferase domain-containing protein [Brachybacterium sp. EF45031]|uniref:molybdenum cofactor guanylyltransferase n=1 Tax=Brachybacterium sillae TaxID=2810536 RepID=UPI003D817EDB|nr:NTP transferase domain-containing protein [Brachybacterium sillae]